MLLNVDPNQFIKVNTPQAAYILGFLWADGFLGSGYSICTEIVSDDAIILENIFASTGKWHSFHRHRKGYKPQTKFVCNSKILYEHLEHLGFNDKTKTPIKLLKTIPKKFHHYWFRGYFDGDGCWYHYPKSYINQCTIAASYYQNWSFMIKLIKLLKIKNYNINKSQTKNKKGITNKYSQLRFCNKDGIIKFGNYIYKGKQFGLTRKLEKYNSIKFY